MMTWRVPHPSLKWKVMDYLKMKACTMKLKFSVGFITIQSWNRCVPFGIEFPFLKIA